MTCSSQVFRNVPSAAGKMRKGDILQQPVKGTLFRLEKKPPSSTIFGLNRRSALLRMMEEV